MSSSFTSPQYPAQQHLVWINDRLWCASFQAYAWFQSRIAWSNQSSVQWVLQGYRYRFHWIVTLNHWHSSRNEVSRLPNAVSFGSFKHDSALSLSCIVHLLHGVHIPDSYQIGCCLPFWSYIIVALHPSILASTAKIIIGSACSLSIETSAGGETRSSPISPRSPNHPPQWW